MEGMSIVKFGSSCTSLYIDVKCENLFFNDQPKTLLGISLVICLMQDKYFAS